MRYLKVNMVRQAAVLSFAAISGGLSGCGDEASLPKNADTGANPKLLAPISSIIPTVNVAPAVGWSQGMKPIPAEGFSVAPYATGLDHPRWLYVLPNGDTLVAETNAPVRPADNPGIRNWAMSLIKSRAGAATPSANKILLLRGLKSDGTFETKSTFLAGLNSPFGMALVGNDFFVANTDAIMKYSYKPGDTQITAAGTKVCDLPAGEINHHWTKSLLASPDGKKLFVSIGSNSNIAENGIENESKRAAVLEVDRETGSTRIFASGLRNANGLSWNPQSGALWAVINERDELGSDLVPDYMTSIKEGGFYGWPYSYYGQHVDIRMKPQKPELVASAIKPDYALGAHTASLGLTFYNAVGAPQAFPAEYENGAFIGQHGSWNRRPLSGYKVIFIPFQDGKPSGAPKDILTGFVDAKSNAMGRPVGVVTDKQGALLVADDVGNTIWRVTADQGQTPKQQSQLVK